MHEFLQRGKWIKFLQFKQTDFDAAPHYAQLYSKHVAECDFTSFIEYHMAFASKQNLNPAALPVQKAPKQTAEHLKQNER